jgi:hypothetical protein
VGPTAAMDYFNKRHFLSLLRIKLQCTAGPAHSKVTVWTELSDLPLSTGIGTKSFYVSNPKLIYRRYMM